MPAKPGWKSCDLQRFCEPNCADVLFKYLVDVTDSLEALNITYYIQYGTLIGAVRDQNIIPWETDIDIVVPKLSSAQMIQELESPLRARGYIVFKHDIVRVCKLSAIHNPASGPSSGPSSGPWNNNWFPYVDLYTETFMLRPGNGKKFGPHVKPYIYPLHECTIRTRSFPCPDPNVLKVMYTNVAVADTNKRKQRRPKYCDRKRKLHEVLLMVQSLKKEGIHIFPRNGFLLGIVRHGGYLPLEPIDTNWAIMDTDVEKLRGRPHVHIRKDHPYLHEYFNGIINGKSVDCLINIGSILTAVVFHHVDTHTLFHPRYMNNNNVRGFIAESKRLSSNGGNWTFGSGHMGIQYDESFFQSFTPLKFYDWFVDVPVGYRSILRSTYGVDWNVPLKRVRGGLYVPQPVGRAGDAPLRLCSSR